MTYSALTFGNAAVVGFGASSYFDYKNVQEFGIGIKPLELGMASILSIGISGFVSRKIDFQKKVDDKINPNSNWNKAIKWAVPLANIAISTLLFPKLLPLTNNNTLKCTVICLHSRVVINSVSSLVNRFSTISRDHIQKFFKEGWVIRQKQDLNELEALVKRNFKLLNIVPTIGLFVTVVSTIAARNFTPNIFIINALSITMSRITAEVAYNLLLQQPAPT